MSNLSGRDWLHTNEHRWPNSKSIDDLDSSWTNDVKKFIKVLKDANPNISIRITSTRRPHERAYLMHFCWKIANKKIEPKDVPKEPGVDIQWDHGNKEKSIKAAQEMVDFFKIAYPAARVSNHTLGKAIDMYITWKESFTVGSLPDGSHRGLDEPSNSVDNHDLHEIGRLFGVVKKVDDAPHWSYNGK